MASTATNRLRTQAAYIGDGLSSTNDATPPYPGQLGRIVFKDGIAYQYVKVHSGADTPAAGSAAVWVDLDDFVVTNDISDGVDGDGRNFPAGVFLNSPTAGNYTWIQVHGPYATVKAGSSDTGGAGASCVCSADNVVTTVAAGTASTFVPLGIATAAVHQTNDTVAMYVCPPMNG